MRPHRALLAALLCGAPIPAIAQDQPPPPPLEDAAASAQADAQPLPEGSDEAAEANGDEEVVVTGSRLPGSVIGNIPPEITYSPRDIRAVGAASVSELLQALAPQTGSGRGRGGGRPVILINGRRISSFSEVRDLPPEAIARLEILPEEVALRYGYRADQRVVNLVLRPRFDATTVRVAGAVPTDGGRSIVDGEVNYLQIAGPTRTSLTAQYLTQSSLLESERDIIQSLGAPAGAGVFRTLAPASDALTLAATHSRMLGSVAATLDGRFIASNTNSLLGLPANDPAAGVALTRESEVRNAHLGLSLNGDIAPWRWTLTSNFDRVETDTVTERLLGVAPDAAANVNQSFDAQLVANGPVVDLWAGNLTASLQAGAELRSFDSESTRGGVFRETSLSREVFEGQASFDLPVTSRREGVLDAIGDLSLNLNLNAQHVSDFGTLTTIGYGVNWRPIPEVTVIASVTEEEGAPGINQLGDPVIATPGVRVFDFVRGETVDITRIDGGNPNLLADSRRVINLGITARPSESLSIRANYTDSRIDNPIASFPTATAEIEAAFPDRFVRDASGRLVSLVATPVNFARSERRELRWGVNWSGPLGEQRPPPGERRGRFGRRDGGEGQPGRQPQEGGAPAEGQPTPPENAGEGGGRGGFGGFGGGRGGFGGFGGGRGGFGGFGGGGGGRFGGRLQFGLFHTWRLEDTVLIRPGVPELDFLDGSAAGSNGGTPRHLVELQAGAFYRGFGARAEVNWQSGTTVRGGADGDLDFSDLTTVNLRLFANLGQQRSLVQAVPFLRNTRISLDIDNLFDSRIGVTDASGAVPLSYQPDYLDPIGRSVRVTLRKQFF